jgi:hypothetical protein
VGLVEASPSLRAPRPVVVSSASLLFLIFLLLCLPLAALVSPLLDGQRVVEVETSYSSSGVYRFAHVFDGHFSNADVFSSVLPVLFEVLGGKDVAVIVRGVELPSHTLLPLLPPTSHPSATLLH